MDSYWSSAMLLSVLLPDEEYQRASDYLWSLADHTEAYQEQAAWLWLQENKAKLR